MTSGQGGDFYKRLGVKRVINGASWLTRLGGSIMPPAVVESMNDASHWFVDLHDLNSKAGEVVAKFTGAEAGLVTAGSAAGMVLEAAACMTGTNPARVRQLPDTVGMKSEIVIDKAHLVGYAHSFRASGAKLVEIGSAGATADWELEGAINDNTAAVAYVFGPRQDGALPLPKVIEIAHDRDVPVIVDAAAMLPPIENLTRYVELGADMVSFSGGKGVLGPQSTGILCGRSDLIEAAYLNSSPNSVAIGRAAKVCKEEIAGLVTALEIFVDTDHQAVQAGWRAKCEHVVSELQGIPGLRAVLEEAHPERDVAMNTHPNAFIFFEQGWQGPSEDEVRQRLSDGDPGIEVGKASIYGGISIIPVNLQDGDEQIIARRLKAILTS